MSHSFRLFFRLAGFTGVCASILSRCVAADDPWALGVRTTEPLTPDLQQNRFRLPPGFQIQLVAADPDLRKPMNLAFDAIGRLWVTESREYPFPAKPDETPRDTVRIFSDFDPATGRARKVQIFADGLNIPIGVYPFRSPGAGGRETWKAIVWSIPNIWLMEDLDGDGKADRREVLYGPFDHTRDTHGNQASFRRSWDGWLYATHGYNNDSHVKGRDGHQIHMNSGNTYRMSLDGVRLEHHTHGQVNPFGLSWDSKGNLYSSDCHSAPIYQLLAGGYYPSFGKPDDGLGFAPVLMEHAHGSTAIDGALYYNDQLWPTEFEDNFFIGNVMTSRLNRDRIRFNGSSPQAEELPDFLTTDDPWFRPVDTTLGPDGALYIADFYNRIIGHYEVPLLHPGRDRERGRLWRVIYRGTEATAALARETGERSASGFLRNPALAQGMSGLIGEFASPNLTRRLLALNDLLDRFGNSSKPTLLSAWRSQETDLGLANLPKLGGPVSARVMTLWGLERLQALEDSSLEACVRDSRHELLRIHGLRLITDRGNAAATRKSAGGLDSKLPATLRATLQAALMDPSALVQRCAVEALGAWPSNESLALLVALKARVPLADTHLDYVVRKSIRDHLIEPDRFNQFLGVQTSDSTSMQQLREVALGLQHSAAAAFLVNQLPAIAKLKPLRPSIDEVLNHAARLAPEASLGQLAGFAQSQYSGDFGAQIPLFRSVDQGLQQRGLALPAAIRSWGSSLVDSVLTESRSVAHWSNVPLEIATPNPWGFQDRLCSDGKSAKFLCSLPAGESLTGILRSPVFKAPARLQFWLVGHDGKPDEPFGTKNYIRLRRSNDPLDATPLRSAQAPRKDTAQRVDWDLLPFQGQEVVLELVDADTGEAYAWIGLGRLSEGGPLWPEVAPRQEVERFNAISEIAPRLAPSTGGDPKAAVWMSKLREVLSDTHRDPEVRSAAAKGLTAAKASDASARILEVFNHLDEPALLRASLGQFLAQQPDPKVTTAVASALKSVPWRTQTEWAVALAANRAGAAPLLDAVEQGLLSARILGLTSIRNRLQASKPPGWQERVAKLTRDIPTGDETRDRLIQERQQNFNPTLGARDTGQKVFQQHCAPCHQIEGQGSLVGPQLTGIGNRGVERLCEDILDPNRNVDVAFRQTLFTLKEGDVVSGLFRRDDGNSVVYTDAAGHDNSLPKAQVVQRREVDTSLMPENFNELISPADFNHLLAYLLAQRSQ